MNFLMRTGVVRFFNLRNELVMFLHRHLQQKGVRGWDGLATFWRNDSVA